jgi:hypothetical protein
VRSISNENRENPSSNILPWRCACFNRLRLILSYLKALINYRYLDACEKLFSFSLSFYCLSFRFFFSLFVFFDLKMAIPARFMISLQWAVAQILWGKTREKNVKKKTPYCHCYSCNIARSLSGIRGKLIIYWTITRVMLIPMDFHQTKTTGLDGSPSFCILWQLNIWSSNISHIVCLLAGWFVVPTHQRCLLQCHFYNYLKK